MKPYKKGKKGKGSKMGPKASRQSTKEMAKNNHRKQQPDRGQVSPNKADTALADLMKGGD